MIRDFQASFTDSSTQAFASIVGAAGTYLAPNSLDTSPLGTYLTELTAGDTQLSANVNAGRDLGGGEPMWLIIDWIQAPTGGTSVDMQLITSASSSMSSPVVMLDLTAIPIATLVLGYQMKFKLPRSASWLQWVGLQAVTVGTMTAGEYIAWLGVDTDSAIGGYASGFAVK
jgi:hypothetical protein